MGDGNAMGKALAFMSGDLRDWPRRCVNCGSDQLERLLDPHDREYCPACRYVIPVEVIERDRYDRARRDVRGR